MGDVLFRDESARVVSRAQSSYAPDMTQESIPGCLSHPPEDLGAQFFFTHFTCDEPPYSKEHHSWLLGLYYNDANQAFKAAVEAIGMVALANIYYAPEIASISKERYWRALVATQNALEDMDQSVADSTLMAVLSLGMYEVSMAFWSMIS